MSYTMTKPVYICEIDETAEEKATVWTLLKRWHFLWSSRRALRGLTDTELSDIGITRAEAEHEATKPFWKASLY